MTGKSQPPAEDHSRPIMALLTQFRKDDKETEARLIPLFYNELCRLTPHYMRGEREGHTLQTKRPDYGKLSKNISE